MKMNSVGGPRAANISHQSGFSVLWSCYVSTEGVKEWICGSITGQKSSFLSLNDNVRVYWDMMMVKM